MWPLVYATTDVRRPVNIFFSDRILIFYDTLLCGWNVEHAKRVKIHDDGCKLLYTTHD